MFMRVQAKRLTLLGPAFVAAVAYVDPGNVATNVTAGAQFGYTLVWVVVLANAMAIVVQYLSAKLGLVTGRSLATTLGERLPTKARIAYWLQAEAIAIATDLAEIVGGAIALKLLFGTPLVLGAVITGAISFVILRVSDRYGPTAFERVTMMFLAMIAVGFTAGLFVDPPAGGDVAGGLVPSFAGTDSILLATGIVGATVMPHVIYLHSSLTTGRLGKRAEGLSLGSLLKTTRIDVTLALILAGTLNLSLLVLAATSLHGIPGTESLEVVHEVISSEIGAGIAILFGVALLSSGLASTSVGCAAGAEVMDGLIQRRVSVHLRRVATMVPAIVILALGADPTRTLVVSQVVLSMGIPFALIPLLVLTSSRRLMGDHVNRPVTIVIGTIITAIVIALNVTLLYLTFTG